MKLIRQPENSNICGQCCIAMLNNEPLKDILSRMGKGKTSWKHLRVHIAPYFFIGSRERFKRQIHSTLALCNVHWNTGRKHWVLYYRGWIFDPALETSWSLTEYVNLIQGRITTFIPIQKLLVIPGIDKGPLQPDPF